ncbi:hypothetical protein [Gordonia sp. CPCC 206044]|uniref:hypothetical protein n=1 Tax=Gordonia sp. CPCC 206044 TaxID=3140793 RepID=UPI003AF39398
MLDFPTDAHGIIFRRTAIDHGFTDTQLSRALESKQITRIWPAAYVPGSVSKTKPEDLHRLKAFAAIQLAERSSVLSHETAGVVHRLSLLNPSLDRVHFSTGAKTGGRIEERRHVHSGELDSTHTTVIDGVSVTSLERTAVDIACSVSFAQALAVLDSALRRGAQPDVLADLLDNRRRGVGVAKRAFGHADGRAENAGESWGRAQIIVAGLPVPRLQHELYDDSGTFVARTDYDWLGRLVAEFDGMAKYRQHRRSGESEFDVMKREKEREDGLRRLGIMVIRWVWDDLCKDRVVPMVREWLQRLGIAA